MAKKIKYEKINPKPPLREDAAVEEAQEALENPEETAASETTSEPSPLEEALKQAAEYKDMALRQRAEFENYRKNNQNRKRFAKEPSSTFWRAFCRFSTASTEPSRQSPTKTL